MFKALIIDDEERAVNVTCEMLQRHIPAIGFVEVAYSAAGGIEKIQAFEPDIIFLDIEMPAMSGFDLLKEFPHHKFDIIFVTAYDQYAINAIRSSALDYLLKPLVASELKEAFQRFLDKRNKDNETPKKYETLLYNLNAAQSNDYKLVISTTQGTNYLNTEDIIRCEAEGSYTCFFLRDNKKIVASKPLKEYDELLQPHHFIRIHRSHLVNRKYVKMLTPDHNVILNDNSSVEVSRRKIEEVKQQLW